MSESTVPLKKHVTIAGIQVIMSVFTNNPGGILIKFDPHFGKIMNGSRPKGTLEHIIKLCIEEAVEFVDQHDLFSTKAVLIGKKTKTNIIKVTVEKDSQ